MDTTNPPKRRPPPKAAGHGRPRVLGAIAESAPASASVDPADKAVPPVGITNVNAVATGSSGALCRMTFGQLVLVRKLLVISENTTQQKIKNRAMLTTPEWL